jgi:hypothetical protein
MVLEVQGESAQNDNNQYSKQSTNKNNLSEQKMSSNWLSPAYFIASQTAS